MTLAEPEIRPTARPAGPDPGSLRDSVPTDDLTVVSVLYRNARLLQSNIALTRALNPGRQFPWTIVDNSGDGEASELDGAPIDIVPGIARPSSRDAGSLHHALALEKALRGVRTRRVLLLDADFYVVRRDWVSDVAAHARTRELGFFGAAWHPRWFYQYRGFPAVHFMLIDLDRVPVERIDLKPAISEDRLWRLVNEPPRFVPAPVSDSLKVQRIRDTGWRMHRRYRRDATVRVETLLPHYLPPDSARYRWERRLSAVLPDAWQMFPPDDDFTRESFLKGMSPAGYDAGWEEFFWQEEPFAFHLRSVGRALGGDSTEEDAAHVGALVDRLTLAEARVA